MIYTCASSQPSDLLDGHLSVRLISSNEYPGNDYAAVVKTLAKNYCLAFGDSEVQTARSYTACDHKIGTRVSV